MNRHEYETQRTELMNQVTEAQASGDPDRMNQLLDQVDQLDTEYHNAAVAAANQRAQNMAPQGLQLENMSQPIAGGKVVETMPNMKTGATAPTTYTAESREYHDGFLKRLQGKDLTAEEMQAVAVVAPGTIPTETVNKIFGKMADSPLLAAINMMLIPGNVSIPVEGTVNDANWVDMDTDSSDSADTVDSKDLGAYKLIKTVEITADLRMMSIPAFEAWLVDRLARKIRKAADKSVCVGTGSKQATGILHSGEVTNTVQYTNAGMQYKDLLSIIGALPEEYLPTAKFVMQSTFFHTEVLGITDTTGRPVVVADPQSPAKYNILGYPVILDGNVTTDNIIFGDLYEGYTFNFAMAPTVDRDESVGFRKGSTVFRGMALADGKVIEKDAFVKATRAGG